MMGRILYAFAWSLMQGVKVYRQTKTDFERARDRARRSRGD